MIRFSFLAFAALMPLAASAQTYSENFNTDDSANWSFNSALGASDGAADNTGNEANFHFDYSSLGIGPAPHTTDGSTFGLKLEANIIGTNVYTGVSVSPKGQSFTGDYLMQFDAYQQLIGPFPASGSGSTQLLLAGIGGTATQAQFPGGNVNGLAFASATDSGTSVTYRAYNGTSASSSGATFAAGSQVYNSSYYSRFQGSVPSVQATNYPTLQTGTPRQGTLGMAWHTWDILKVGNTVTWSVDGLLIATATAPAGGYAGTDIFLGQSDINSGSSTQAASRQLNFGIVDNLTVTPLVTPEPAPMAACGLGALALLRRRRRG